MKSVIKLTSILLSIIILAMSAPSVFSAESPDYSVNGDTETSGGGKYYFLDEEGRIFEGIPDVAERNYISDYSFDRIAYYNGSIYAGNGSGIYKVSVNNGKYETVYYSGNSVDRFSLSDGNLYILDSGTVLKLNLSSNKTGDVLDESGITSMWLDAPYVLSYMTDGRLIYSVNLRTGETAQDVNFYSAFIGDIPVASHSNDGSDGLTLNSLQSKFPAGKYWNHMGSSVNNPNGYTSTPCNHSANGSNYCNQTTFYSAWQCHGYGLQCGYDISGSNPMNWTKYTSSSSVSNIRAGDIIRLDYGKNDHTMVTIAVSGDTVYFTDVNSYGTCNIRWGATKTKSTLTNQFKYLLKCPDYLSDYITGGTANAEYTVKFDLNDSTGEGRAVCDETSRTVKDGNSYGTLPVPTREGYDFDGWYTSSSGGTEVTSSTIAGSNATVYAHWNLKVYLISYNANADGENISNLPSNQTKKHYETVSLDITSRVLYRANYNFNYWNTSPDGSGTAYDKQNYKYSDNRDVVLYAQWDGIPKSVYFEPNGGTVSVSYKDVKYGSPYGELPVPVRDGYNFKYWKTSSGTVISSSSIMTESSGIRLYAEWEDGSYHITYDSNSGGDTVYGMPSDQNKTSSQSVSLNLTEPSRYGYIFTGWNSESNGSGTSFKDPFTYSENKSITIYAQWKPIESKVTFDSNGGSSAGSSITVRYGETYGNLPVPSMTGKDFLGWFTSADDDGSDPVTSSSTVRIINDTTLYAHWDTAKYAVRYIANNTNVTNMPSNSVREYGQSDFRLDSKTPIREGFTFVSWNTSADGSGTSYYPDQKYSGNSALSLNAIWKRNTYAVIYNANGGTSAPDSQIKEYDIQLKLSDSIPVRSGYTFNGWNTYEYGGGESYSAGDNYTLNKAVTLYAQWTANSYTVRFDAGPGKSSFTRKEYIYDSSYSLPTASRKGYAFEGWFTSDEGGVLISDGDTVKIENDTVFYARWRAETFTVSFDADGGVCSVSKISVRYDSLYGRLPVPVKKGFAFAGWFTDKSYDRRITDESVMKFDSDITLVAAYTAGTYTVVFDSAGGSCDTVSKSVCYGDKYGVLPVPVKSGYSFEGWVNVDGEDITSADTVSCDYNHILYAVWKAPVFSVSFYNGSDLIKTAGFTYGMPYGELPVPVSGDKVFCGWYDSDGNPVNSESVFSSQKNISLYSRFAEMPSAGTVRFISDGIITADIKYSGDSVTEPPVPPKQGYNGRWSDYTLDGSAAVVQAVYEPESYTADFVCGGVSQKAVYRYGDKIELPTVNPGEGYAVSGWNPDIPLTMPASEISFVAALTEITYTADFIAGGKSVSKDTYTINSKSLSEPVVPPKSGYTGAWESYRIVPGGMTVFAVYTPISYTAEFTADGVQVATKQFTVEDDELSLPPVPEKTGYTGEWGEYEILPQNITVDAVYTANIYTVTFMIKETGKVIDTVSYYYGEESVAEPSVPAKEQCDGKWSEYTLGATDTVSYAVYTPKVYIATFMSLGEKVADVPFTAGSDTIMSPPVPVKFGVKGKWEKFTVINDDFTVNAVYSFPTVSINNYVSSRNVDYKTSIYFTASVSKLTSTATVHWFVNDVDQTPSGSLNYTVSNAVADYTIQAKLIADGNVLSESSIEKVTVSRGLFARIIAFFRQIFGRLPFIRQ